MQNIIDTSEMPTFIQNEVARNTVQITDARFGVREVTLADKLDEAIKRAAQSKEALEYIKEAIAAGVEDE